MASIELDLDAIESLNRDLKRILEQVVSVRHSVSTNANSVSSAIADRRNIRSRLSKSVGDLQDLEYRLGKLHSFINDAVDVYSSTDRRLAIGASEFNNLMNQISNNLKPMTGEPSREARKAYLTELAQAGGAAAEWARHELAVLSGQRVTPLERRQNELAGISAGNSLWYNDLDKTIEALYKMKEDIQNHGNLELYLADDYPREYYEAIQRSSFVKITGEWDEKALNGIQNVQMKYDIESIDNGIVDLATIKALILNAESKMAYYNEHPNVKRFDRFSNDLFGSGLGDAFQYGGLSMMAPPQVLKSPQFNPSAALGEIRQRVLASIEKMKAARGSSKFGEYLKNLKKLLDSIKELKVLKRTGNLKPGTLSNEEARKWYLEQEANIPNLLNKNAPLEQQARQAFELRNQYRTKARELMSDREAATSLNKTDPNMTWTQMIQRQKDKGLTGDDIYKGIIESSQKSRQSVNESLGL